MATKRTASTSRKSTGRRAATRTRSTAAASFPDVVYAQASPHSVGGVSMFDVSQPIAGDAAANFMSEESVLRAAATRLQAAGFQVLQISTQTINIAGPPRLYNDVFSARLYTEDRAVIKGGAEETTATFVDSATSEVPGLLDTGGSEFADVLEGIAIEEPRYFMAPSALAPNRSYWYLDVPGDVSLGVNADKAHRAGVTGKGVKVVMVDSGHYAHPYFAKRGYKVAPVVLGPAATNAAADESGHGTGESANVFAAAPDVNFTMVKINFVNSIGAFNSAVGLGPAIISCSWGSSVQFGPLSAANQALAAAIALAVTNGIVVVFSAGNGHWGFPGQHPDVISAGGVFMDNNESLKASDYASGFASNVYAGRNVPDVSGLVGMKPGASYIMLPVEPGDDIDASRAGGSWPGTAANPKDETLGNDGWAVFSGTSAAAPQIAGICALIKQVCAKLTPAEIRGVLKNTAKDVTVGTGALGNTAAVGYDLATGAGLVDAHKAVVSAQIKCLTIVPPIVIGPPVIVGPPIVQPPVVVGPPVVLPPVVRPPVVNPPVIVGPPVVLPPLVRPPIVNPPFIVGPPVINPPPLQGADPATIAAQMAAAGYTADDIRAYLAAESAQPVGITEDQAELLQAALLESDVDLGL